MGHIPDGNMNLENDSTLKSTELFTYVLYFASPRSSYSSRTMDVPLIFYYFRPPRLPTASHDKSLKNWKFKFFFRRHQVAEGVRSSMTTWKVVCKSNFTFPENLELAGSFSDVTEVDV